VEAVCEGVAVVWGDFYVFQPVNANAGPVVLYALRATVTVRYICS
jgi:hypothetical protein